MSNKSERRDLSLFGSSGFAVEKHKGHIRVCGRHIFESGKDREGVFYMKKNKFLVLGMSVLALTFGMVVGGCSDDRPPPPNNGEPLPAAVGENALSGKTYFDTRKKIVFDTTTSGATSGGYKIWHTNSIDEAPYVELLEGGKYKYIEIENGTYSWDETAKTVTLKPEKVATSHSDWGDWGVLQNRTEFRAYEQEAINGLSPEELAEELAEDGFSSVSACLDYWVNEVYFANNPHNYAFSEDGEDSEALFLDQRLPANKGTNELSGKTFHGKWTTAATYVFTASDYTYTSNDGTTTTVTGTYAYDSQRKYVYLKPATTDRKSKYSSQTTSNTTNESGYFINVTEYNAAQVNSQYRLENGRYNATALTINN
jgi:hypothetical protein